MSSTIMKNGKKNIFLVFLFVLLITSIGIQSCSYKPDNFITIRIKGSDTMLYLTKNLAEEYMRSFPGISVYVEGGGTASGIRSLINDEINILTASRTLKADEVKILAEQYGAIGISFNIARDALSIYINPENPVKDFTLEQLEDIFTCRINNWYAIGGDDSAVIPVIRSPNSGTYLYFKEHVLNNMEYCSNAIVKATTEGIIDEISKNKYAAGYGGIGYGGGTVHAKVNGIEPSEENVRNDSYPISRYLYFYTLNTPEDHIRDFINWVMGPEGQRIVKQSGYISLFEITF
ncbi:MAG: phosphate ABC transporter substrate-binding protein [Ignavibacteriaceae bacterium]